MIMNYQELENVLQSPISYSNTSDEELLDHFKQKFTVVPYQK